MTPSKIFLYFCLFFIAGVFLNSLLSPRLNFLYLGGGLIFGLILISIFWKYKNFVMAGFCILFLVFGIWRHQNAEIQISKSRLQIYNDAGETISLIGIVANEPDIRTGSIKLIIDSGQGKILVTTNRYPEYNYGDKLKLTGKLKTPADDLEGFNYKDYLSKDGTYSEMSWPEIEKVFEKQGNPVYSTILSFKERLRQVIYQNLSPPQSSVLGAVILGDKRQISEDLKSKLNIAGVRHITAISGMHITILAGLLMYCGLALGFWREQVFYFTVILLILYIIMVGAPASAVRAGIMGGIVLFGQKTGRISTSSRALIFVAAAMLFQNPLILKLDIGFQLSFLAVMGIIYLMPLFQNLIFMIPNPGIFPLKNILSMTLAAQIFTLPILIYNFGYFSLAAPLTNILIVPLIPFIMVFGFIFSLVGIFLPVMGWVFSWPSWFLLAYIIKIINFFSMISFAKLELKNIHWLWLASFYLVLVFFIWRWEQNQKLKFLQY
ncbi:MAG: ComEC/Rec2 family competence protein [Parcubacteria group bacterium]